MKNKEKLIGSIIILVLIAIFIFVGYFVSKPKKRSDKDIFVESTVVDENKSKTLSKADSKSICVQIKGAVEKPGIYNLSFGSRLVDLVNMAGGLTKDADEDGIVLVKKLADSDCIIIKRKGEVNSNNSSVISTGSINNGGKIDINTATVDELDKLPGIGRIRAESIVKYREENGAFNSIEDLKNISGIGDGILSKFKDMIEARWFIIYN